MTTDRIFALALAALLAAATAPAARAAEAYANCTGFIPSLPATIGTQGIWCMDKDLSTAVATGVAIDITANNVTIECNGFKLGGLQAGLATGVTGIRAEGRSNTTIRGCNIRGFRTGVSLLSATGGYVVEDNRFDANTSTALRVFGDGSRIQRNQILHTGGSTNTADPWVHGIYGQGTMDIIDNQVHDVAYAVSPEETWSIGIRLELSNGGVVAGNVISGIFNTPPGAMYGIYVFGGLGTVLRDNDLSGVDMILSEGIRCTTAATIARGNVVYHYYDGLIGCTDTADNFVIDYNPT